mgnify:CR=1 FL=1
MSGLRMYGFGLGLGSFPPLLRLLGAGDGRAPREGRGGERGESDGLIDEWWEGDSLST